MKCYCLFCETAKCRHIQQEAEILLPCQALYPRQIQHSWSKGKPVDIAHDLLPGYVFLYFPEETMDLRRLWRMNGVIRCLRNHDGTYELQDGDEQFALMLLNCGGVIGKTQVYREGQMIRIKEGAFAGLETRILKVNHRNMRMQIEIPFAGAQIRTWVEYEMVEA